MLSREHRLSRLDFTALKRGKRATTEHFSCSFRRGAPLRVGIVISKKVAKKATDRHLLKRRMSAIIEKERLQNGHYAFYARKDSPTLSFPHIKEEITTL